MKQPHSQGPLAFFWQGVTSPPYLWVPVAVCLYVLIICFIYPYNGPFTGHMIGFDDQVRMTQVLNLINGAGWYDRTIMRVNAPEGFSSIWTRLVDIPIALTVMAAQIFTDQKTAALAASVILPFIELIILFFAARYAAGPLVGKDQAWLVVPFIAMTSVLNQQTYTFAGFHFGEASHHSWYIILNVVMTGAAARIATGQNSFSPDKWIIVAIGLLLGVGIEGLPLIAGLGALLGFIAWVFYEPAMALRSARAIGGGAILGLILLPLHLSPTHLLDISFAQPSILGSIFVGAVALFLFLEYKILNKAGDRKILSLIILVIIASVLGAVFLAIFPEILVGATAALSPEERRLAANEHPESWTMFNATLYTSQYVGLTIPTVIGVVAGLLSSLSTRDRQKKITYLFYMGSAGLSGTLAQIYWRYIHHALVAACPWLVWLLQKIRQHITNKFIGFFAGMLCFTVIGVVPLLVLPAIESPRDFWPQIYAFPAVQYLEPYRCDMLGLARYIDQHYSPDVKINVPGNQSAYFLFQTHLKIDFLANFPSQNKFIDNKRFFTTQDLMEAKYIAAQHGFDLVAMCGLLPLPPEWINSRPTRLPMLSETLAEGHPPPWLKPVDLGFPSDYLLFEVDKNALKNDRVK